MSAKLEEGGKILAAAVTSLKVAPHQIVPILRQGDPKDVVLQVADEENSDLIIMGARGLKRLESILKNSVSQYVFQLTDRPMLLVKDGIYIKKLKRVLVAMDRSDAARESLSLALSLVREINGGQLFLVHVNPESQSQERQVVTDPEKDPVLATAAVAARKQGIAYRCLNRSGNPGEEICRLAEELNVDLLILGSPDRRPSIAKKLTRFGSIAGGFAV